MTHDQRLEAATDRLRTATQEYIDTGRVTHDEPGEHQHECAAGSLHAGELSIENPCICRCGAKYISVDEDVWFDVEEAIDG